MSQDKLSKLFHMQKVLQEGAYGTTFDDMSIEERVAFIKEMTIHANQEMNELLYELPFFKPWKDYSGMTVTEQATAIGKAKEEYVDFLHFFLNIGIGLGVTPEELYEAYIAKNTENYRRQEAGYTHDITYR